MGPATTTDIADGPWTSTRGDACSANHYGGRHEFPIPPIDNPDQRGIMFWLPPGGTDNGVWASARAELADLRPADVGPVLGLLAEADIGGYMATRGVARDIRDVR